MPENLAENKAQLPYDTIFFVYQHGSAPWDIADTSDAVEFVATAKELGAATWLIDRTLYLFQPPPKPIRRAKR